MDSCGGDARERRDGLAPADSPGVDRRPRRFPGVIVDPDLGDPTDLPTGAVDRRPADPRVRFFNRGHDTLHTAALTQQRHPTLRTVLRPHQEGAPPEGRG